MLGSVTVFTLFFFYLFRKIRAGSTRFTWSTVILSAILFLGSTILHIWMLFDYWMRPSLVVLVLVSFFLYSLFLIIFVRGLFTLVSGKSRIPHELMVRDQIQPGLLGELLDLLALPGADIGIFQSARKAAAFSFVAVLCEGTAYYAYVQLPGKFLDLLEKIETGSSSTYSAMQGSPPAIVLFIVLIFLTMQFGIIQAFFAASRKLRRKARRLLVQPLVETTQSDERPPVLFLRSFKDDQMSLESAKVHWFIRVFDPGVEAGTFEEIMLHNLSREGPIIAVGNPKDVDAPIGASREYLEEDQWKDKILHHLDEARLIVISVDETDSLMWEVEQIVKRNHLSKTLFFFPPRHSQNRALLMDLVNRIQAQLESKFIDSESSLALNVNNENLDREFPSHHLIAFKCGDFDDNFVIVAENRTEVEYELALRGMLNTRALASIA